MIIFLITETLGKPQGRVRGSGDLSLYSGYVTNVLGELGESLNVSGFASSPVQDDNNKGLR